MAKRKSNWSPTLFATPKSESIDSTFPASPIKSPISFGKMSATAPVPARKNNPRKNFHLCGPINLKIRMAFPSDSLLSFAFGKSSFLMVAIGNAKVSEKLLRYKNISIFASLKTNTYETYISALTKKTQEQTRVPYAYGFCQRAQNTCCTQKKRQKKTYCIKRKTPQALILVIYLFAIIIFKSSEKTQQSIFNFIRGSQNR